MPQRTRNPRLPLAGWLGQVSRAEGSAVRHPCSSSRERGWEGRRILLSVTTSPGVLFDCLLVATSLPSPAALKWWPQESRGLAAKSLLCVTAEAWPNITGFGCGLLEHPFRGSRGDIADAPVLGAACGTLELEVLRGELCPALTMCCTPFYVLWVQGG